MYDSTAFAEPATWVSRLTLLAIVLGIDNIILLPFWLAGCRGRSRGGGAPWGGC